MAETIVSPGVLAIENDQSFITQQPVQAGAAIIGPTVKGKVGIPTVVTSYTDYLNKFGDTFLSGSNTYTYFTSIAAYNYFNNGGPSLLVTRVVGESFTSATSSFISASAHSAGSPYNTSPFILETISEGVVMNSTGPTGSLGTLLSGSSNNVRWQITNANTSSGTFNLLIRQGNDSTVSPSILETWGPLSLDPYSNDYIEKVIGNQVENIASDAGEYFLQLSGSYPNKSSYVRVKQINQSTPDYFDNVGNPKPQYTGSIPANGDGTFGSATGKNVPTGVIGSYYENIISQNNIQGISASAYTESIALLANKDAFSYNLLVAPGLLSDIGGTAYSAINSMITNAQNRGDMMVVFDSSKYGSTITSVLTNTVGYDTSYAATYWPWVKTVDPGTANQVWVPVSTMIPGIYAFNDNATAPWFAPAGVNRGVLTTSTQAERVLTQGNRDTLYQANINPISTYPNTGVVIFGQKTLQKRKSSLDRINVRRLLIELKSYISQIADTFVFEQNDVITRNNFLSIINPYLASVQQQQGLTAFKVIMDESNNPPSVVDNNQLIGQIYLQPTKSVEFIILDFNILPTGATFPA
jgi:phage tail sheath protein FI